MSKPLEILQKYWQHDSFREPQEQIIQTVLDGNDCFALMPTGGGKSVCFQIPALLQDGLCLVISPLVALMKDQVQNLQKKDIKAIALTGGISAEEVSDLLDNCLFGNYKFLYISPERLQSDWVLERIKNLPINLIAIDEAHCVSQWGNDFRPAFLKIALLKEFFPKVPFLALTASATKKVQEDIISLLNLDNPKIFVKSFARENISYQIRFSQDKLHELKTILSKNNQPSIVYVSSRKSSIELSNHLSNSGIKAIFYHGGLKSKEKQTNMQLWLEEKVQSIVATNAFGMGIDKPNVRTVIHYNYPQNIENYYQEAGRGGRDGDYAEAILLSNQADEYNAESQFLRNLPDTDFLKLVYKKLNSYFQIAYGEGIDQSFSFNLNQFCVKYSLDSYKTYNAIQFLDRQGILSLSQEFSEKISLQFIIESKEVLRYMSLNPNDEEIILTIVRTYPGIYEYKTAINVSLVAKKSNVSEKEVIDLFQKLEQLQIIDYFANKNDSTIIFNQIREDELTINRVSKYLKAQNELKIHQLKSILYYIKENKTCKSKLILRYFGEIATESCGICSVCKNSGNSISIEENLEQKIKQVLQKEDSNSRTLQDKLNSSSKQIVETLQSLLEKKEIYLKDNNCYSIKK